MQNARKDSPWRATTEIPPQGAARTTLAAARRGRAPTPQQGAGEGTPQVVSNRLYATGTDGRMRTISGIVSAGLGVPRHRISAVDAATVDQDGHILHCAWRPVHLHPGHPSRQVPELLEHASAAPDHTVFVCPQTPHTPVLWFLSSHIAAATAAGYSPPIAQGPSQYDMPLPATWEDIFHSTSTAWQDTCKWVDRACTEAARARRGMRFRTGQLPGGKEGLEYGVEHVRAPYGALQWHDVAGRPVMVRPELPDQRTNIRLDHIYRVAQSEGIADAEIISEMRLFGVTERIAASPTTALWPGYGKAWQPDNIKVLLADRQRKQQCSPAKLTASRRRPLGYPMRRHPRSVVHQLKLSGKVKARPITDAGAKRQQPDAAQRHRPISTIGKQRRRGALLAATRAKQLIGEAHAQAQVTATTVSTDSWQRQASRQLRRKGKSGEDSVNARVCKEQRTDFALARIGDFTANIDTMLSSGLDVDIVSDDFEAWYEQAPVDILLLWFCAQLISEEGMEFQVVGDFGYEWKPNKLNRFNYVMETIKAKRLRRAMASFSWSPWSPATRAKAERYTRRRRQRHASGDWFDLYPFFDDNSSAVFAHFRRTLRRVQYDMWHEFSVKYAPEKAVENLYGCAKREAIIGWDLDVQRRQRTLPQVKVERYCALIDEQLERAHRHPKHLVEEAEFLSLMGKIGHAVDAVPTLWDDFIVIFEAYNEQRFQCNVRITRRIREHLAEAKYKMQHENGVPFTSYELRPGADGLPVWVSWTDASRKTGSFFGAAGGWFHLWETQTVFFFTHTWPAAHVEALSIGELEMVASDIAAELQFQVHHCMGGRDVQHYLLQYGDNSAVFNDILNNMRASACGMRFLARRRARSERARKRLLSTAHVRREFNSAADALANADIPAFIALLRQQMPSAELVQLQVPVDTADLAALVRWVQDMKR
eukprot:SAG25_NODE_215_length_11684_cov_261.443677_9_plen_935_part_00